MHHSPGQSGLLSSAICVPSSSSNLPACLAAHRPPRPSAMPFNHWDGLIPFLDDGRMSSTPIS
jgi:hypothetical protein